jgi:uncharacterized protein YjiS (DUF1127 family)
MANVAVSEMRNSQHWRSMKRLTALLLGARRQGRDRAALARFGERDLRDPGVSRATLAYELNKALWHG